jgi:hypothetical protein
MARLHAVALVALLTSIPSAAQTVGSDNWRFREVRPAVEPARQLPGAKLGANGRFGIGMFGIRDDSARRRPVIVREVDAPRHRRAGVGFSLKF